MTQASDNQVDGQAKECSTPTTKECAHCHGTGECQCETCAGSTDLGSACADDVDTGRQNEGTCRYCDGLGRVDLEGHSLER